MERRPIESDVDTGASEEQADGVGVDPAAFRDALAEWAATVTVVAVRDGGRVYALTATSFAPVSAEPPLVLVSLGPNAVVLPFLDPPSGPGTPFAVSLLAEGQGRVASVFADAFPVGPSPFPPDGPPVVEGAVAGLACSVRSVIPVEGGSRLVVARVEEVMEGSGEAPLLYHRRGYRELRDPRR